LLRGLINCKKWNKEEKCQSATEQEHRWKKKERSWPSRRSSVMRRRRKMRNGQMKEFYAKANALLKIRRTNPVVTRVQREDEIGEVHTFEEKSAVDLNIAKYFTDIYKRPD
jgi:hypothetical protein